MARRANNQWHHYWDDHRERIGHRPKLASEGGPAGRPTGKRRDTKARRKRRR